MGKVFCLASALAILSCSFLAAGCHKSEHDTTNNYFGNGTQTPQPSTSPATLASLSVKDASGQSVSSSASVGSAASTAFTIEGVDSNGATVVVPLSEITVSQNSTACGVMGANLVFVPIAVGSCEVTVTSTKFSAVSKTFTVVVLAQGSSSPSTPVLNSIVIRTSAGLEVTSPVNVFKNATVSFSAEGVRTDGSRVTLSAQDFTVQQNVTGPGVIGSTLVFAATSQVGTVQVTVRSTSVTSVSRTFAVTVIDPPTQPVAITSLIIRKQSDGQEVVSPLTVGVNTSTAFSVEAVRSDNSHVFLSSGDISVVQSNTASGVIGTSLVFVSTSSPGQSDITVSTAFLPTVSKSFSIAVVDTSTPPSFDIILDAATRTVQVSQSSTFTVSAVDSTGTTQLNPNLYAINLTGGVTSIGSFTNVNLFTADSVNTGTADLTVTVTGYRGQNKTKVFPSAITVVPAGSTNQAGQLVESISITPPSPLPGPGQTGTIGLSGTVVGGAPLTDYNLVHWSVLQGDAVVDRDGKIINYRSGEQIRVRARALGAIAAVGSQIPNSVASAVVTYTAGSASLDMNQVYPERIASFISAGMEEKVYARQGNADVSTVSQFSLSLVNNANGSGGSLTASLRRDGNTWFIKGLNEGTWDLVYSLPGSPATYTFRGRTVMGDVRRMRDNTGNAEIMDAIHRFAGVTRDTATGRMALHILVKTTATEFTSTIRPGFRGPGMHTGGSTTQPGYDLVDPYPAPVQDVANVNFLLDAAGNRYWHFVYEFTPAVGDTSFRVGDYHILGDYLSPTSGGPNASYAFTIDPERSAYFLGTSANGNYSVLLRFDAFPGLSATVDQIDIWADSVAIVRA